jgi:hypothetical protein
MIEHNISIGLHIDQDVFFSAEVIRVTKPDELPPALAQKDKSVVIEDPKMAERFRSLQAWQEARYWFFGTLITAAIAFAISQNYKIELSWHRDWKVNTLDGKVTLTPVKRN